MSLVLAIESSTAFGGIAIAKDGNLLHEEFCLSQKAHSEKLNTFLQNCLQNSGYNPPDLNYLIVGNGPGSFTGIRVAVNIARALSFTHRIPIITCDTLTQLALQALGQTLPVVAISNAYKNMVFFSIFDCSGKFPKTIAGPGAIEVSRLGEVIPEKSLVVGDGYDAYLDQIPREVLPLISRNPSLKDLPSTQTLIQHFELIKKNSPEITWKLLNPLYIRASAAEESIHKL